MFCASLCPAQKKALIILSRAKYTEDRWTGDVK